MQTQATCAFKQKSQLGTPHTLVIACGRPLQKAKMAKFRGGYAPSKFCPCGGQPPIFQRPCRTLRLRQTNTERKGGRQRWCRASVFNLDRAALVSALALRALLGHFKSLSRFGSPAQHSSHAAVSADNSELQSVVINLQQSHCLANESSVGRAQLPQTHFWETLLIRVLSVSWKHPVKLFSACTGWLRDQLLSFTTHHSVISTLPVWTRLCKTDLHAAKGLL